MPFDRTTPTATDEARRQIEICNACRYCEGYCSVFPAITRQRAFAEGDITQFANLCHNCRGCYHACQYAPPHEFGVNLPAALAEVRQESWERFIRPAGLTRRFTESGGAIALAAALGLAVIFAALAALRPESGEGFYAWLSHTAMVAIFTPAFLLPLGVIALGLRDYWRHTGGGRLAWADLRAAFVDAGRMKNLDGGQGQGCNYEREDRFSNARRHAHQATLYGFLLCFGATSAGTVMHYGLGWEAPYPIWSLPKLLGVPGGILLCIGTAGLVWLKLRADPALGARRVWSGEIGFTLLLFAVAFTGLALWAATGTAAVPALLAIHLGTVLAFFLLMPYSKMVHGFFRLAALTRDAQARRLGTNAPPAD